ncbi:MAG TPA: CSLREA domain-containing protein, partial [Gammaproteobacteria bacterium]|nr:CSLREA domain-containing protein [Gammaproteobacteria bacterium]
MARHPFVARIVRGLALGMLLGTTSSMAATFAVNSAADTSDSTPGDGICADAGGVCSLRAAIEEANALAGPDTVSVPSGNYLLTQGSLVIKDAVTVTGAYTGLTVLDGNANGRVFSISSGVGEVTLETMTIQNGSIDGAGGGVATGGSLLTIRNAIIRDNVATGGDAWGGAIYIYGAGNRLVVENSLITRNSAGQASAIRFSNSDVELRNTTLSYNHSANARYGVIVDFSNQPSSLVLENTTITGNTGGTGMTLFEAQTTIVNSTIAGNSGGAAINAERNSSVTVTNSILYGNNRNCSTNGGTITSGGHNIEGRDTCGFAATGDRVNTDPMLGPLADNSGPTPTRGLLAGSPALNTGDNSACLATDQRGTARDDGACDIGAFEGSVAFATCLPAPLTVDSTTDAVDASPGDGTCADVDGNCTLRAAINEANACAGADSIVLPAGTYPLTIPGLNENAAMTGDLDITDELGIEGAGATATIIDASNVAFDDRIFHVLNNMPTRFSALTLQSVSNSNLSGGGIATGGDLQVS